MYISATTWLWPSYWKHVWNTLSLIACTETSLCRKWKSLWMNCKYKLQFLEGMVYSKSSLTFLFIQTYSFVGLYKREKEKKQKERTKKVHFDGTPLCGRLLLSYQKKSQMSKDSFQLIFHFWFVRRPQNCAIIRHGPRDKTKIRVEILAPQQKSQYFWFCRQKLVVCSEIPFSKNSYHTETSQLICFANEMIGFYMIQVLTERYFRFLG